MESSTSVTSPYRGDRFLQILLRGRAYKSEVTKPVALRGLKPPAPPPVSTQSPRARNQKAFRQTRISMNLILNKVPDIITKSISPARIHQLGGHLLVSYSCVTFPYCTFALPLKPLRTKLFSIKGAMNGSSELELSLVEFCPRTEHVVSSECPVDRMRSTKQPVPISPFPSRKPTICYIP